MTLSVSAGELSRCRFLVSPLLEVLAAGAVLCGQHAASSGWRRRNPLLEKRLAPKLPQAVVQHRIRLVAEELLHMRTARSQRDADFSALGPLEESAREFFEDCLHHDWPRIRTALESDVAQRAHSLAARGVRQVVDSLPGLTLREVPRDSGRNERGLILVPSVFQKTRAILTNEWGSVVTYAVPGQQRLWDDPEAAVPAQLATLLGRGRAAALLNIGIGCGTNELAARLAVSPGTASVHVTALRNGGLVATHRVGKAVMHVLTPVGSALIAAQISVDPIELPGHFDGKPNR
ncbi:ArsR/SmtB family transcription factor [Streptomyces guryensis]|uniref:Winged helix-turn-helix domain-containing protein n=1 Tax=Streptomyces guryensis TaxID=2886947 RepID=A0A9Q3VX22_9ACTN|nr:winged helix-turn-helix domain-containing protein [Streptomyces guryensis]MCD9878946.1 winged helix-turn-helix domain-containing protein [Streptomyces guryensis]